MSKFLVALLLGLAIIAIVPCDKAVAVQSGSFSLVGQGAEGSGVLTLTGPSGAGFSVHALQADGTYALQANGRLSASGSVTFPVVATVPSSPETPMFNVRTWTEGRLGWFSVTPNGDDDGWWLW